MELGVHELINLKENESAETAYARTKDFVLATEKMNYKRFWFAEHHNSPTVASVSPEILIAYMAAITNKIRLGTGGTMVMHYSPLRIAEEFKTLSALAPGRIDLGLGRAPGSGPAEITALAQGRPNAFNDQYDKIEIILQYLSDQEADSFYGQTRALPEVDSLVEPWMLGSSGQSAVKSGQMGLGYSFAKFFGIPTDASVFQMYRDAFEPSEYFQKPSVIVSYSIIVADSEEEADYIAKPLEFSQLSLAKGRMASTANPEKFVDLEYSSAELNYIQGLYDQRFLIKGTPTQVESILAQEIEELGIDEILVYAPIYDDQARLNSYKHLAKMFSKI